MGAGSALGAGIGGGGAPSGRFLCGFLIVCCHGLASSVWFTVCFLLTILQNLDAKRYLTTLGPF